MALNLFIPTIVKRSDGRNVIFRAAYNAREKLTDERTGDWRDYSDKYGLEFSDIFAPKDAPAWVYDRQQLWNEVEAKEDRGNNHATAQLARDFKVTLPYELTPNAYSGACE